MRKRSILSVVTKWLLFAVGLACIISLVCTYLLLSKQSRDNAINLVTQNLFDVMKDIHSRTDEAFINDCDWKYWKTLTGVTDPDRMEDLIRSTAGPGEEVSIIRNDGVIIASTAQGVDGENVLENNSESFEAAAGIFKRIQKRMEEYSDILENIDSDDWAITAADSIEPKKSLYGKEKLWYYGETLPDLTGIILYGVDNERYIDKNEEVGQAVGYNRHIGRDGYMLVVNTEEYSSELRVVGGPEEKDWIGKIFPDTDILTETDSSNKYELLNYARLMNNAEAAVYYSNGLKDIFGEPSYYAVTKTEHYYLLVIYPKSEADEAMYTTIIFTISLEILVFVVLLIVILFLVNKIVINDLHSINSTLSSITHGNLDEKADVRDTYEFNALSDDINATVDKLKEYIAEAAARIDADLEIAKAIQTSVLPNVFPPFPEWHQFELFASMQAAKEVGGDFYDFYMLDGNRLGFLIADVSGKSIPGAMFMMRGKSVIKSLAEEGLSPAEVFTNANEKLCEGNDAELFITAWIGYLDLKTGEVHVANAGHNPPVLIRDGSAEYVILKPGLMLAGMDGTVYKDQTLRLQKGDILYLYTDGVTEAMDADENQYGEDRLLSLLSFGDNYPDPAGDNGIAGAVCELVAKDIEAFVQGAEQSDDITMLCVRYLGES